ncbi:Retrovirus-related Pol polyprotein from transposon TNT 1-94 [Dendrobium catenatum]|uniref:Retrovirus-related Pol polyprotein from transposon TNT 1-94 n=1 Tax=Dendrobium catenatum TaxID=906689 RepID=A0A2I0VWL4_9ASPA|nr:Retrovirus-related Pol polyprotein from transposon TNT 1-94 [Dendrobium catenatum]
MPLNCLILSLTMEISKLWSGMEICCRSLILAKACYLHLLMTNQPLLHGPSRRGLYPISTKKPAAVLDTALVALASSAQLWHRRLGHPSSPVLQKLYRSIPSLSTVNASSLTCNACDMSKSHKLSFSPSLSRSTTVLNLIHSDVWGPSSVISLQGFKYYVIFIDDFSRYCWLYPLRAKSDVVSVFYKFKQLVERQFDTKIKHFRSDGGGEYCSNQFNLFLENCGIIHQITCPYTPEQNGLAERKHRHIMETARALLFDAHLPRHFWLHAVQTAVHLINLLPSISNKISSPHQTLFKTPPDYTHLKSFGCLCYPYLPSQVHSKLHPKSLPCIFLGYPLNTKGYICHHVESSKTFLSRHVKFIEHIFPCSTDLTSTSASTLPTNPTYIPPLSLVPTTIISTSTPSSNNSPTPKISNSSTTLRSSSSNTDPALPNTSSSPTTASDHSAPSVVPQISSHRMLTRFKTGKLKPRQIISMDTVLVPTDPTCYTQAVKQSHWRRAMSNEFEALQKQGTWKLVPPSPSQHVLGCKWIYKTKLNSDGIISRYKARLVAQGCNQQYGLDYDDTFSPVAKLPTIRIFLKVAVTLQWTILQLDVSNAFLHGKLTETVFMKQPSGFIDPLYPDHVCLLQKAIYGLKQSPRKWFETFSSYLLEYGFLHSSADPSLLFYHKNNISLFILVYVDDILLTGNHADTIQHLLSSLSTTFHMKNLGKISHFLGMKVTHVAHGLHLSQSSYATEILTRAGMAECKSISSPSPTKFFSFSVSVLPPAQAELFRHIVGSLQYLTLTRPDIAFTVNKLCQHMHQPLEDDFKLLKRLLRYVKGTLFFGLPILPGKLELSAFSDSDWAGDPSDRKSTSGYCAFLGETLISWQVKKQKTVARSSTEAEYRALATATTDLIWLRRLLHEFHIDIAKPTFLFCDNISAMAIATNPIFHARTKHIEIDFHFIRDCIKNKVIQLSHVHTQDQLADVFTKPLSIPRFTDLRNKLTISEAPVSLRGGDKQAA